MKRLVAMMAVTGAAVVASAMPTKAELQKAQAMVSDVTSADVKALKSKTKTPAEVAAKHMELAGQAGNEAEKYVLLQGAFKLYAKAGDYEGAANALGTMNREIADMNPEVIVEIYNKAIFSSMKERAPKLFAIKEVARRQVTYRKQLAKAEAAVKANPKDTAAQKKLGECYAELGNWPKALDAFALAGGALAKTAAAEKDGSAAPQVSGDFWWDYESGDEMSTYKLHAAELYRAALADDSFKGLARTRTEQRVKAAEEVAVDLPSAVRTVGVGTSSLPKFKAGDSFEIVLDSKGKVSLELAVCPLGEFEMKGSIHISRAWSKKDQDRVNGWWGSAHKVQLTYPFLIMKGPLSYAAADVIDAETAKKGRAQFSKGTESIIPDLPVMELAWDDIQVLATRLNEKLKLPSRLKRLEGYEMRLPTEAEWCYAVRAGSDAKDWAVVSDLCKEWGGYWWGRLPKGSYFPFAPLSAMKKSANPWGLFYLGPKTIYADTFDGQGIQNDMDLCYLRTDIFQYADSETNPVRIHNGESFAYLTFYGGSMPKLSVRSVTKQRCPFRFVFAPKLSLLNVYPRTANDGPVKRIGEGRSTVKKTIIDAKDMSACYPREDFGGELLSSKYEIVEHTGGMSFVRHLDRLFNCERVKRSVGDGFAFEVSAKEKEVGFTLMLPEPITLAGLLVVNRAEVCKERQVPLCVWVSENRTKWERIFIDESVRDEYRIDLSKKNITCKYLRFGRLPGVNNEPFHLARTLVYAKPSAAETKAKK